MPTAMPISTASTADPNRPSAAKIAGNLIWRLLCPFLPRYTKIVRSVILFRAYLPKRDLTMGSTPLSIGRVVLDKVLDKHLSPLFAEPPMRIEFFLEV